MADEYWVSIIGARMYYILEEWKPVVGYEDYYEVSNYGRVKSLEREVEIPNPNPKCSGTIIRTWPEKIAKQCTTGTDRHMNINLTAYGRQKMFRVHTLVLEAFDKPRPEGMECRHLDGDCVNNFVWNLKWGTKSENSYDSIKHGTHTGLNMYGDSHPNSTIKESQVLEIHELGAKGKLSRKQLSEKFNISRQHVSAILSGRRRKRIYEEFHRGS